ncbi:MAG TPA: acyltransferase, partial [Novosphingobium sp.]|nr:acyltransferase [Novosphingobium sp.]
MCATRSAAASAKASRNIAALDLLRWCSAALVWAYHAGAAYLAAPSAVSRNALTGVSLPRMLVGYSWFGWIGVEIFFILSGYVIARSAEGSAPGAFIRRRALRLLPAAWLCASLSAACVLVAGLEKPHIILDEWAASAFFLSPLDQIDGSWWTLGLEVDFYLLVALCLWGGRRWPLRWLPAALTLACAGFWLYRWMGHSAPRDQWGRYTDLALLRHGAFFALGMLMERRLTGGLRWPDWLTAAAALGACAYEIYDHADER